MVMMGPFQRSIKAKTRVMETVSSVQPQTFSVDSRTIPKAKNKSLWFLVSSRVASDPRVGIFSFLVFAM